MPRSRGTRELLGGGLQDRALGAEHGAATRRLLLGFAEHGVTRASLPANARVGAEVVRDAEG